MQQYKNSRDQFQPEKLPVGWPWRLFVFSLFMMLAVVLIYTGLRFGYKPYLSSKITDIDNKLGELNSQISAKDKEDFINSYSQLANLKNILNKHVFTSKIFPLLEKVTHQRVYFNDFSFKMADRKLILNGTAESYGVLSEQLAAFDGEPTIENYILNQSKADGSAAQFKVTLTLSPNLFLAR